VYGYTGYSTNVFREILHAYTAYAAIKFPADASKWGDAQIAKQIGKYKAGAGGNISIATTAAALAMAVYRGFRGKTPPKNIIQAAVVNPETSAQLVF
jgi:hypothetical protein